MAKRFLLVALALAAGVGTAGAMDLNPGTMFFNTGFSIGGSNPTYALDKEKEFDGAIVLGGAVSFDWLLYPKIGLTLGLQTGFSGAAYGDDLGDSSIGAIPIMFRVTWHPGFVNKAEKLDVYLVGAGGIGIVMPGGDLEKVADKSETKSAIAFDISLGAKYFFTKSVGVFAELGMDLITIGYEMEAMSVPGKMGKYTPTYSFDLMKYATVGVSFKTAGKPKADA